MKKEKSLVDKFFFPFAHMLTNALNYALTLVYSWNFTQMQYGEINALFSVLFVFAIPSLIVYTLIANKQSHQEIVFTKVIQYLGFLSLGVGIVFGIGISFISEILSSSMMNVGLILGAGILSIFLAAGRGYLQGRQDFFGLGKNLIGEVILKVIGIGIVFVFFSGTIDQVLIAINLSILIAIGSLYFYIFRHHTDSHHFEKGDFHLDTILKTSVSIIGVTLLYNIDMIFVRSYSPEISGDYSVISRLSQLTLLASMIFIQLYSPKMIGLYKKQSSTKKEFIEVFLIILLGGAFLSSLYFFFGGNIIQLLFGSHFTASKELLSLSNIGFVIFAVGCLIQNYLVAIEKYFVIIIPIISCILYVFLSTFFHDSLQDFVGILFFTYCFYTLLHLIYIFGFRYDVSMQK